MLTEFECRSAYASAAFADPEPFRNVEMGWSLDPGDSWPVAFVVWSLSPENERTP